MDARSFHQHSARVAEMTDALLAERAAAKAAQADSANSAAKSSPASGSIHSTETSPIKTLSPATADQAQHLQQPLLQGSAAGKQHSMSPAQQDREQLQDSAPMLMPDSESAQHSSSGSLVGSDTGAAQHGVRGAHYCSVCNVSTTSALHLQTHYMGAKHQRRLAQVQDEAMDQHHPLHCATCGITATSDVHLQLHLNGRAHQKKARLAAEGRQRTDSQSSGEAAVVVDATADARHAMDMLSRDPSPASSEHAGPSGSIIALQPASGQDIGAQDQQSVREEAYSSTLASHHNNQPNSSGNGGQDGVIAIRSGSIPILLHLISHYVSCHPLHLIVPPLQLQSALMCTPSWHLSFAAICGKC